MEILIAYLSADRTAELDIEYKYSSAIDKSRELQEIILTHPEVEYYKPTEFALAFNNEFVSDLGLIAIVDAETRKLVF